MSEETLQPAPNPAEHTNGNPRTPAAKAAYLDLFDRSLDAIVLVALDSGKIIEANDSSEKILQASKETIEASWNIFELPVPEALDEFRKMVRIASRRYHPKTFEVPLKVQSAEASKPMISQMALSPLKLSDGTEVLQFIIRDITKMKDYIKQIEEMAITDGMTGLTNFRQFTKLLEMEHARALRYRTKYAIVFCDIDHFKKYNDQNGHPAGDALLKQYAQILRSCVRTTDFPCRYGGEEFVVLLPQTDSNEAAAIAERIRSAVRETKFEHGEKQPLGFVSISIGVSAFPRDGADPKQVLKAADNMLYECKEGGRNCVKVSRGPETPVIHHQG